MSINKKLGLIAGILVVSYPITVVQASPADYFHTSALRVGGALVGAFGASVAGMVTVMSNRDMPSMLRKTLDNFVLLGGATFVGAALGGGLLVSPVQDQAAVMAGALIGSAASHTGLLYMMQGAGSGGLAYFIYEPVFTPVATVLAAMCAAKLASSLAA